MPFLRVDPFGGATFSAWFIFTAVSLLVRLVVELRFFFLKDRWSQQQVLCDVFPRLFSFVSDVDISVRSFVTTDDLGSLFALPLSPQAYDEYRQLCTVTDGLVLDDSSVDVRQFVWDSQQYSSARFYKFIFQPLPKDPAVISIWRSKSLPKLRVFDWLLLMDRLNTKDMMIRRHWHVEGGSACVLCSSAQLETRDHLFFSCPFTRQCWDSINIS